MLGLHLDAQFTLRHKQPLVEKCGSHRRGLIGAHFLDCLCPQLDAGIGGLHRVVHDTLLTILFLKASTKRRFSGISSD